MEIWLPYGDTEIVLDIKVENILDNIKYQSKYIDENKIVGIINNIDFDANICLLDDDKMLGDLVVRIRNDLSFKGITTTLYMPDRLRNIYKEYNVKALDPNIYDKKNTVLVGKASYDPLFGYEGVATKIVRNNKGIMKNIINDVKMPSVGRITKALSIAYTHIEHFESRAIEIITDNSSIIDIVIDDPIKANKRIIDNLPTIKSERCKSIVIGSGYTNTLTKSLRALWNCVNILKDECNIILLAEGSNGLGSEALDMFVQSKKSEYMQGMEDLIFINWARARYDIHLITALPDYYVRMIGFKPFRSINHALKYIIGKNIRQKITIVQNASNIRMIDIVA